MNWLECIYRGLRVAVRRKPHLIFGSSKAERPAARAGTVRAVRAPLFHHAFPSQVTFISVKDILNPTIMGSSASKASRAAGSAARQYPKRAANGAPVTAQAATTNAPPRPPPPASHGEPGPTVKPQPHASSNRSEAINLDASDPDFAQSLRQLGPVQPNPTLSPTSAFNPGQEIRSTAPNPRSNPALAVLDARARLQDEAEVEFMDAGRRGHDGRQFLDVYLIRQILTLRDQRGRSPAEIERQLGLKKGVVERLGARGVVDLAQETGRAQKEINMV